MISCGGHRGEALKCSHDAPESSSRKSELFPQTHPSPPSFWSLSSFTGGELTSPTQKRRTFGECGIHFFIAGRLFVERMLHRPHSGVGGHPHAGGEGAGAGTASMAWHGPQTQRCQGRTGQQLGQALGPLLLENPRVGAGPGAGEAWRQAEPQGDCAIRVCP